jgi:hypothetical protein
MPSIYVKVIGIDADFDEFTFEEDHTVQDLKTKVLAAKTGRLIGLNPSDLKVYNGDSEVVTGLTPERIQSQLSSYTDSSFVVVPVTGALSTITKLSGKLPSVILSQTPTETVDVHPEFKLIPFLPPDSKIRQMIERPIELHHTNTLEEAIAPDVILHPSPNFRSAFGAAVGDAITEFIPQPVLRPETVDYTITGNSLSDASPVKRMLDLATGLFIDVPVVVPETPVELVIPADAAKSFKQLFDASKWHDMAIAGFDKEELPETYLRDLAREFGATAVTNALQRMRQAPIGQIVKADIPLTSDDTLVWIALGTMSSGETFTPHLLEHVEAYCTKNLTCFESTKKHKLNRFFIDIDGFTPADFNRQQFNEIDSIVKRTLFLSFYKTCSILTSSCYRHLSQRVGPLGSNIPTIKNKLSYRVIFKNVHGTLEAMDYWLMREIAPKLKAELSGVCTVTEQEETEKIQVPEKMPVIILDRWNYYGGDRMRMMGSSKELETRPLVPVGEMSFLDTVISYVPPTSFRLPDRLESSGKTRVPIWEPF